MFSSIGERLAVTRGRPSGFDYLRLGLAVSVVAMHSVSTTFGRRATDMLLMSDLGPFLKAILPMFFALSGFLVAGSLERSKTIVSFLGLRAIRIFPALAVEVVLSAFLIGPLVTAITLSSYFRDPLFLKYLLNLTGDIHYYLPGVFESNPYPRTVNGQLWTVPYELLCYVTLTALVLSGALRQKLWIPLAIPALALADVFLRLNSIADDWLRLRLFNGYELVMFFLAGVSFYLYRSRIVFSRLIFYGALVASLLFWFVPFGEYPAVPAITYVTVYLGLTNARRLSVINGADYSYGIFLYGWVIQQSFVYLAAPAFWWINALVCVPLSALVAAVSWHFVEKPAQKLRKYLLSAERHYLTLKDRVSVWKSKQLGQRKASIDPCPKSADLP
jgi:peptidoglycan/LPS O-acetylase OafA/YrhL